MKVKIKSVIAAALAVLTLLSSMPVMAASVGSSSADKSAGEDTVQGVVTEYGETSGNSIGTDAYLTVDSSDLIASVPTTIILSGVADENGAYTGDYSVTAQGDISGTEFLYIEPVSESVDLIQSGKDNVPATITQEQTVFTSAEVSASASSTGTVSASSLTAGSWNADSSFLIGVIDNSVAKVEYFTWGEDADFMSAYESSDLSDYPGLTVAEENENSTYSYPDATAITGLTDEGIEWIEQNEGKLILPTFATSIADSTNNGLDSAFGRWNRTYGSEINDMIMYVYSPENIKYIGSFAFAGLEELEKVSVNAQVIGERSFVSCCMIRADLNGQCLTVREQAFFGCPNLVVVDGTENVIIVDDVAFGLCRSLESIDLSSCVSIGNDAFNQTFELNSINPTNSLKSIGDWAFFESDCNDDFSVLTECEFGECATTSQTWANGIPDYIYTPVVNDVRGFYQRDARWSSLNIANISKTYGPSGCGWCCLATAYNYFNDTDLTPVDIVDMVYEIDPSLIGDGAYTYGNNKILSEVGLTNGGTVYGGMSSETDANKLTDLQSLMNGLAAGNLVHLHIANRNFVGRHGMIAYGITEDGELMCVSSDYQSYLTGDPDYATRLDSDSPLYFTLKPEHILMSCDSYEIISKG